MNKIKSCKKCNLHNNQPPLLDKLARADVIWMGLSAKKTKNEQDIPLNKDTISGNIINKIEEDLLAYKFYKTNLVKCLPLENHKLRYPNKNECAVCFENFIEEIRCIKPKIVFLLGKIVSDFVKKEQGLTIENTENILNYTIYCQNRIYYIPIPHPSYIYVYKRHQVNDYIKDLTQLIIQIKGHMIDEHA